MLVHLPIVILMGLPTTPVADDMPKFDITRECKDEGGPDSTQSHCVDEEKQALQQLHQSWPQFSGIDRRRCTEETTMGGSGSYVEFLTCLEMARDTRNPQQGGQSSQTTGSAATKPHK